MPPLCRDLFAGCLGTWTWNRRGKNSLRPLNYVLCMWAVYRTDSRVYLNKLASSDYKTTYNTETSLLLPCCHFTWVISKVTFCVLICVDQYSYSNMPSSTDYQQYQTWYFQCVMLPLMKIIHYPLYPACDLLWKSVWYFCTVQDSWGLSGNLSFGTTISRW